MSVLGECYAADSFPAAHSALTERGRHIPSRRAAPKKATRSHAHPKDLILAGARHNNSAKTSDPNVRVGSKCETVIPSRCFPLYPPLIVISMKRSPGNIRRSPGHRSPQRRETAPPRKFGPSELRPERTCSNSRSRHSDRSADAVAHSRRETAQVTDRGGTRPISRKGGTGELTCCRGHDGAVCFEA